mmetsp:Transcript_15202/g.26873  ORF Transcript_15202/g.26873 Transcript_15202/m.26873 type:complete len:204 (+) Transcript_15202:1321-1932(+)
MNILDHIRLRKRQKIIITLDIRIPILESLPAILLLLQNILLAVVLDHGPHSPVIQGNLVRKKLGQICTNTVTSSHKIRVPFRVRILRLRPIQRIVRGPHLVEATNLVIAIPIRYLIPRHIRHWFRRTIHLLLPDQRIPRIPIKLDRFHLSSTHPQMQIVPKLMSSRSKPKSYKAHGKDARYVSVVKTITIYCLRQIKRIFNQT